MSEKIMDVNGKQILEALKAITKDAEKQRKERGLDFRFLDRVDGRTEEEKDTAMERVKELEDILMKKPYKIIVEFYENIDIKDTSKGHKYYFRIYDENNCFVEIDALEYRNVVIDSAKSEEDYITEAIFKLKGLKVQENVLEISKLITELISYVYYYDELQYKLYENIGWDIYNNELIFKYDVIYKKNQEFIRSACLNEIAGRLTNDEYTEDTKAMWRDKLAKLMNSSTVARTVISAACTGLIRSIMPYNKENNINMNICGKPGSGKSSLTQFALSIFGDPRALEGSFIDKDNAMEMIRVKRPVIPYILDDRMLKMDTLSDKAKSKELLFDVFREYEGKVAERMNGSYKELFGKRTNAPIISSSVESMLDVLLKSGDDLGQYRRFIELELKREDVFNGDSRIVDEYHKLSYQNYGIGFQYIVYYILNVGGRFVNKLYDCILNDITKNLDKKSKETGIKGLTSSASRFALVATTYIIIREAINEVNPEHYENNLEYREVEFVGGAGVNSKEIQEVEKLIQHYYYRNGFENKNKDKTEDRLYIEDKTVELLVNKEDDNYEQLVDYLIDNLVNKMKRVVFNVNVYENIMKFLEKEENKKWFIQTSIGDYIKNHITTHMGYLNEKEGIITIAFRGKKYVEWLFCSGKEFTDKQIKEYLAIIKDKKKDKDDQKDKDNKKEEDKLKEQAISLFGKDIVNKEIEVQMSNYENISWKLVNRDGERNIFVIKINPMTMNETEEQK